MKMNSMEESHIQGMKQFGKMVKISLGVYIGVR